MNKRQHPQILISLLVLAALLPTGLAILPGLAIADLAATSWPMFQHDLQHTGRSPYLGPQTNTVEWSYTTGDKVESSPAIGSDGTVYIGSHDGKIYAINPAGALQWSYITGDKIISSPAIGSDGTLYVGSEDYNLYAIRPDGSLKWSYALPFGSDSSPAIGSDSMIYIGSEDDKLYAINPHGSLRWSYTTGDKVISSPAIGSDGVIYVGSEDGKLYAINPHGSLKWSYTTGGKVISSPAIGSDGVIYVGSEDHKLYAINPDGSLKWSYETDDVVESSPAMGSDGTLYVGSGDGKLYAYSEPTSISSCNPINGVQGQTLAGVIITGTNFTGANNISFGVGVTISSFTLNSATQITASISITPGATPGSRDVSVMSPRGTGTLPGGFTVLAGQHIALVIAYIIRALILFALVGGMIFTASRKI